MAALPFYAYSKATKKPPKKPYDPDPKSIGDHIRKARVERGLLQRDLALILKTSEDTITYWENRRSVPQMKFYPSIIEFLGYYPLEHETDSLGGKLRQIRHHMGFDFKRCADHFHVSVDAIRRWESGRPMMNPRLRSLIESVWESLYCKKNDQNGE